MPRMLLFAGVALVLTALAYAVRLHDAPYIAYQRGDLTHALAGLAKKAEDGDGFAAYLVGQAYETGAGVSADPRVAAGWYMTAARAGEIRAVPAYVDLVLGQHPSDDACRRAVVLLELAARAGELNAMTSLGALHRAGLCVARDLVVAASYLSGAARRDRRIGPMRDVVLAELTAEQAGAVRPLPDPIDLDPRQALARFVTDAPALLPDNLR